MSTCRLCLKEKLGFLHGRLNFCVKCYALWKADTIPCGHCGIFMTRKEIAAMHEKKGPICENCQVEF